MTVPIIKLTNKINHTFLLFTNDLPILLPITTIDNSAPKVNKAEPIISKAELSKKDNNKSNWTGI